MTTSTNTGGGGGGGFTKATTETQTGDAETLLQETPLPDADGVYNVIGRIGVSKKDAADEYAAIKRFEKSIRKAGGSIQQIVDHSDSESFQDLVGGLFSDGDLTLKDGPNGPGLYGESPENVQADSVNVDSTEDLSSISGVPTDADLAACDTAPSDGTRHYAFDDSSDAQISYYPEGGPKEQIDSERAKNDTHVIDLAVDSNGDIHAIWSRPSDGNVRYSVRSGGSWSPPENVDSSSESTRLLSLDIDQNDIPHCSYIDGNSNDLLYAERIGGSWSKETIVSGVTVGFGVNIYVESDTDVGIAFGNFTDTSVGFAEGQSGSFSVDTAASTNGLAEGVSIGGRLSSGDWSILWSGEGITDVYVTTGTVSGGFSDSSSIATTDAAGMESVQHYVGSDYSVAVIQGNSSGSNPYDAEVYTNNSGSWSFDSVVETFGAQWSAHRNDRYVTIADNGTGDTKISSINLSKTISATLQFNTGAEVTNADA